MTSRLAVVATFVAFSSGDFAVAEPFDDDGTPAVDYEASATGPLELADETLLASHGGFSPSTIEAVFTEDGSSDTAIVPTYFQQSSSGDGAAAGGGDSSAQANNPLANMRALNFHNYLIGRLSGTDTEANQFVVRYAQPVSFLGGDWLIRASLPVNTYPAPPMGDHETGLGDFNVFAAYLTETEDPAISFGIGPQLTAPTATDDALGAERWSAGLANVFFDGRSKTFQYGYLLTWQHSFTGPDVADVNVGAFQPFAFLQLGEGRYLRAAPIWVYNFDTDGYGIPLGLGYGRVIPRGNTIYNIFIEPQWSVADRGPGQPEWQIFLGFNIQFLGGS